MARGSGRRRRPRRPLTYESRFWSRGLEAVAGVDEAGRGPLAGPVVAAAVVLPPETGVPGAVDSKRLRREEREEICTDILQAALAVGIGAASVREIDRLNILVASALAMRRALEGLGREPDHVVIDGPPMRALDHEHEGVVDGDARIHSIACASIVAKVHRDRLMRRLSPRYPGYGWERNVGYGTPEHVEALRELGPTPHHRRSFNLFQLELDLGPERELDADPEGPCTPST